jgi:hypothetical protein
MKPATSPYTFLVVRLGTGASYCWQPSMTSNANAWTYKIILTKKRLDRMPDIVISFDWLNSDDGSLERFPWQLASRCTPTCCRWYDANVCMMSTSHASWRKNQLSQLNLCYGRYVKIVHCNMFARWCIFLNFKTVEVCIGSPKSTSGLHELGNRQLTNVRSEVFNLALSIGAPFSPVTTQHDFLLVWLPARHRKQLVEIRNNHVVAGCSIPDYMSRHKNTS